MFFDGTWRYSIRWWEKILWTHTRRIHGKNGISLGFFVTCSLLIASAILFFSLSWILVWFLCVFVIVVHLVFFVAIWLFFFPLLRNDTNLRQWFSIDAKSIFNGNCIHNVICLFIFFFLFERGWVQDQNENVEYIIYHRKIRFSYLYDAEISGINPNIKGHSNNFYIDHYNCTHSSKQCESLLIKFFLFELTLWHSRKIIKWIIQLVNECCKRVFEYIYIYVRGQCALKWK